MNLQRLYLDYNATSPLSQSVSKWLEAGDVLIFANPSSQHSDGKASRKSVNETRSLLFKTFNKSEKDTKLFFHSGATEAFHTFAYSFSETARLSGKELLICFSKTDHPAVTSLAEKYYGPHVKFFEIQRDRNLRYSHDVNFEALKDKKDNNPDLIILYHHLWVHNETGQISDIDELVKFKTIPDLFIHTDAVQVPGKIPNWARLSCGDIWSFSAHKFGSLKGVGFSFFRNELPFHPLISGGSQQGNLRSGTENILGIKSVSLALSDLLNVDVLNTLRLRNELVLFMKNNLRSGVVFDDPNSASNTIYFYLNNLPGDVALALFDVNGLEISSGSACSSGAAKASPILLHMGLSGVALNGLRLSLPFQFDEDFLHTLKSRLQVIFNKL